MTKNNPSGGMRSSSSPESDIKGKVPPFKNKPKKVKKAAIGVGMKLAFVSLLVVPAVGYFGYHYYQLNFVLPLIVNTPSMLPKVTSVGAMSATSNPELYWGTYRANLYFGMGTKSPQSPAIGIMWYEQPQEHLMMPKVRHWCSQHDELTRYGWMEHDGRHFGVQDIVDRHFSLQTTFVKRPGGKNGGDWTARVTFVANENAPKNMLISTIVYIALNGDGWLRPKLGGKNPMMHIESIDGETKELGRFTLRFSKPINAVARSFLAGEVDTTAALAHLKELIIANTGVIQVKSEHVSHYLGLMGYVPNNQHTETPNFLALQVTFLRNTEFDIIFESNSAATTRKDSLSGPVYDHELTNLRQNFNQKFEKLFGLIDKQYADVYIEMGKLALSNMLGSMSYFHGYSKVISQYNKAPVQYGPLTLFSAIPSRPFFPRGFLWDEGFHHLLLRKWDPDLSLESLGTWLDLMNIEGWIPREMILGGEAEVQVPAEYIVQNNANANPPMFFYLFSKFLADKEVAESHRPFFQHIYPRLKLWYQWLNTSQVGQLPGTYRWRGRNATTVRELNPKTLTSGLDDYPRASHPTTDEYHLDLYCWMAMSSRTMAQLADFLGEKDNPFKATAQRLTDPQLLDKLHWSDKMHRYSDYGLHTRNVKLERVTPPPDGPPIPTDQMPMVRVTQGEPKARLVSDTFGYVSLFPLMLKLLPSESPKLKHILTDLVNPDLLWTEFGLRSLAKTSPLYNKRNTEHDPPYWRGSIWINLNYLVLDALHHYSHAEGPHRDLAFETYAKLRSAVVTNVVKQYSRTGYLWEHYNDETGAGEGTHPFTGWSSLVLLMMAEQYD